VRVRYRLLHPSSRGSGAAGGGRTRTTDTTPVAVEVADPATVGDVARALAALVPGAPSAATLSAVRPAGETGDQPVDPAARAVDALPRSGSTVRLAGPGPGPVPPSRSALPSPVRLVGSDGTTVHLPYGRTFLPADGPPEAEVVVHRRVRVLAHGAADLTVDGQPVHGGTVLAPGAVVVLSGTTFVAHFDGDLRPPPASGPVEALAAVRAVRHRHERVTVDLPTPPAEARRPAFPWLTAGVPVLLGAGLWLATGSAAVAGFVLLSVAFVVASALEVRREARAERRFREAEFRRDLAVAADRLERLRHEERERLDHEHPPPTTVATWAVDGGPRRWERRGDGAGTLSVRLGTHDATPTDVAVLHGGGRRDLADAAAEVADAHRRSSLPAVVDLADAGGLAVVGGGEAALALARSVLVQVAGLVGPDVVSVELRCPAERLRDWEWLAWLPHVGGPRADRHLVVVDARGDTGATPPPTGEAPVLWLADDDAGLPSGIGAAVGHADGVGWLRLGDDPPRAVRSEGLTVDEAEPAARALAALRPIAGGTHDDGGTAGVRLDDLTPGGVSVEGILDRWDGDHGLRAPIGRSGGGVLWLDLERDGPHGLLAGTTGSGKSEALRTLVSSLALHHPPERVTFLLVDYKGGAAFGPLTDLPHTVGVVTDLTPDLAHRAITSLRAEVLARERLLRRHGATDLTDLRRLTSSAPPALVVVVDEFATLARELPDLLDGFVDLAQRGRSLGLHLVLATQRPAGVVTESIRANTGLRIALRVAGTDESLDVVGVPDAADLPRSEPGRALLHLGPGQLVPLRVAWTGGPAERPPLVRVEPFRAVLDPESGDHGHLADVADRTQLDQIVGSVRRAVAHRGGSTPPAPWLPPLPRRLRPEPSWWRAGPGCRLGMLDLPRERSQPAWELDLRAAGGLAVVGASGSGTTTALRSLAEGIRSLVGAVHVWVVGTGPGADGDHAPATVVAGHDVEATLRLLRALDMEVDRRRRTPGGGGGEHLLVVDGLGELERAHERVNRGEALELLARVAAAGASVGVHVAVAARHRSEIPPSLLAHLGHRLVLRCATEDDALLLGAPAGLASPDVPPGRGVVVTGPGAGAWVQVATARAPSATTSPHRRVPHLPELVRLAPSGPRHGGDDARRWRLPVGVAGAWQLGEADLPPAELDLTHGPAIVAGPPRSGRSTALRTLARSAERHGIRHRVLLRAAPPRRHHATAAPGTPSSWTAVVDASAADAVELHAALDEIDLHIAGGTALIAVDDLPRLLDGPDGPTVEAWLAGILERGRREPVRVVAAGESDAMLHCYVDPVRRLRNERTGLLLQPDPDLHPALLHATLPCHDELFPAPGRGWLVDADGVRPVQVALAD
jgi:S-DNA-T family DNA segregation ATPase FtsK/SpoIIIE